MDTLEIPRLELMNYLPYSLIEEALEYNTIDLATLSNAPLRKESRIKSYTKNRNSGKLQTLMKNCDIEQEVSKEVNKILHSKNIYNSFLSSIILDQTKAKIKNLLRDSSNKENVQPFAENYVKGPVGVNKKRF
jgi:hypothetical protein